MSLGKNASCAWRNCASGSVRPSGRLIASPPTEPRNVCGMPAAAAGPPDLVAATSKTFRTLARLAGAAPSASGLRVPRELTATGLGQLVGFVSRIESSALAELPGVSAARAHQVPAGAVVAAATLRALDVPCVRICPWALREGVILRRLDSLGGA